MIVYAVCFKFGILTFGCLVLIFRLLLFIWLFACVVFDFCWVVYLCLLVILFTVWVCMNFCCFVLWLSLWVLDWCFGFMGFVCIGVFKLLLVCCSADLDLVVFYVGFCFRLCCDLLFWLPFSCLWWLLGTLILIYLFWYCLCFIDCFVFGFWLLSVWSYFTLQLICIGFSYFCVLLSIVDLL